MVTLVDWCKSMMGGVGMAVVLIHLVLYGYNFYGRIVLSFRCKFFKYRVDQSVPALYREPPVSLIFPLFHNLCP